MNMKTRKLIATHYNRTAEIMSGFSRYFGNKTDNNVEHAKAIQDIETTIGQLNLIRALIETDRDGAAAPTIPSYEEIEKEREEEVN